MKKLILVLIVLNLCSATLVFTQQEEEIKIYLGKPESFPVSTPQKIIIGDPRILDVVAVAEDSITLVPKEAGLTKFSIWDSMGEQVYRVRVLPEDLSDIKVRADNLIKELNVNRVQTKIAETEGKVLLLGEVKTQADKDRINTALGALKEKTVDLIEIKEEEAIVDIDVQVLELGKGAQKQLGLAWPTSVTLTEPAGRFKATLAGIPDAFFRISEWTRGTFSATLSFLESEGKARVLSQPRLACQSGKEAELVVGGEKPIFTTSVAGTGATGTGVEYKEYGIKLKIKPSVTKDKRIKLALNVEVSELESTTAEYLGTSGDATAKAYPLKKRSASTELFLNDGQTMAIGGLIKQKTVEDLSKFPWLADIPVLGLFFRSRSRTYGGGMSEKGDSELFIILTPTIIAAKEQAEKTPVSKAGGETKPPLGRQENISAELKDYINAVQLKIMNAIYYPEEAEELGWEGTVGLVLRLASDGNLKEARILQSSGYKLLDEAALEVVQKQTPYPVFPKQIKLEELRIQVPVVYRRD